MEFLFKKKCYLACDMLRTMEIIVVRFDLGSFILNVYNIKKKTRNGRGILTVYNIEISSEPRNKS